VPMTMHSFCKSNRKRLSALLDRSESIVQPPYVAMNVADDFGQQLSFLSQLFSNDPTAPCFGGEIITQEPDLKT